MNHQKIKEDLGVNGEVFKYLFKGVSDKQANWLAHDLFHIRQVSDLHFAYLTERVKPVSLDYSGWES